MSFENSTIFITFHLSVKCEQAFNVDVPVD